MAERGKGMLLFVLFVINTAANQDCKKNKITFRKIFLK